MEPGSKAIRVLVNGAWEQGYPSAGKYLESDSTTLLCMRLPMYSDARLMIMTILLPLQYFNNCDIDYRFKFHDMTIILPRITSDLSPPQ